jgi:tryptophan synthase alpha chain
MSRLPGLFRLLRATGRRALIPYLTCGWPSKGATLDLLLAAAGAGADAVELGVPFSDPVADGPVIQGTTHAALTGGVRVDDAFRIAERFTARSPVPLLMMTYCNLVDRRGTAAFARDARRAGVEGLIVADLPPEEAGALRREAARAGLALTFLCAPTSTPIRVRAVCRATTGFVYLVSVRGVTGARAALPADLAGFVGRVRKETDGPVCVGFGISTPAQAAAVGRLADGVIVGSALLREIGRVPARRAPAAAGRYLAALRHALDLGA